MIEADTNKKEKGTFIGIFGQSINLNNVEPPRSGGYYYEAGVYESEITAVKKITTRGKGPMLVVETLVLESSNPNRPAGSRPAWTQLLEGKAIDVAPQNIKMFLTASAGLNIFDPKDSKAIAAFDWDSFGETAISEDNPLKGFRVHIEAIDSRNKAGGPFTKMVFTPSDKPSKDQAEMTKVAKGAGK